VAVVNLHITYARTMKVDYSRFSLGGLHGKHVVAMKSYLLNHEAVSVERHLSPFPELCRISKKSVNKSMNDESFLYVKFIARRILALQFTGIGV
jgi:hypothetical protein